LVQGVVSRLFSTEVCNASTTTARASAHGVRLEFTSEIRASPQPLEPQVRQRLEPLFQHDFGNVRVYADDHAHARAESHDARAFTAGSDLYFGAGRYAPHTDEGQHLIAHELAHVVQNERYGESSSAAHSRASDASETEARGGAMRAMAGFPVAITQSPSSAVARDGDDDESVTPPVYPFLPPVPNVQLTPPSMLGGPADRPMLSPNLGSSPTGPTSPLAPFNFGLHPGDPIGGSLGFGQPVSPMFPPLDSGSLDVPRIDAPPQGPQLPGLWNRFGFGLQGRRTEDEQMIGGALRFNF
jgi:hypothetical protein